MTDPLTIKYTQYGTQLTVNDLDAISLEDLQRAAMTQRVGLLERQLKGQALDMLSRNDATTTANVLMKDLNYWLDQYAAKGESELIPIGKTQTDGATFASRLSDQGIAAGLSISATRKDPNGSTNAVVDASGYVVTKSTIRTWLTQIQSNVQNLLSVQQAETLRSQSLNDRLNEALSWMDTSARFFHESRTNLGRA